MTNQTTASGGMTLITGINRVAMSRHDVEKLNQIKHSNQRPAEVRKAA